MVTSCTQLFPVHEMKYEIIMLIYNGKPYKLDLLCIGVPEEII